MRELIELKTSESGKKTVSAKELYLGLGLNKSQWSRWNKANIECSEFFREDYDWLRVRHDVEGNETTDFEISLEFAKHIAMMARTEKSHQYRNYFLICEAKLKEQQNMIGVKLSPMEILEVQFKALKEQEKEIKEVKEEVRDIKENTPLFNIECEELQKAVRKKGVQVLGGKGATAYKNKSIRTKIYADIQHEIKREFDLNSSYKAIKRKEYEKALDIIEKYEVPYSLGSEIIQINNQIQLV
jgi:anti-repressor protein